jgi:hypothetical protein
VLLLPLMLSLLPPALKHQCKILPTYMDSHSLSTD